MGRTGSAAPSQLPAFSADTDHFKLTYYDPPPGMERHILALFHFEWDAEEISDLHPGALPQMFLTPFGSGEIRFGDAVQSVGTDARLFSGFDVAAPFRMTGPWHAIGASLSPLGWAALTGQPASDHVNRLIAPAELLGDEVDHFTQDMIERYRAGSLAGDAACLELALWLGARFGSIPRAHEKLIEQTLAWLATSLNPEVDDLVDTLAYSRRQTERLVRRYFGATPASLGRKFRAVRAARILIEPDLSDEAAALVANAFYDQPHMIREIRRYCGYTPTRLGGRVDPLFQTMIRLQNLDRLQQTSGDASSTDGD